MGVLAYLIYSLVAFACYMAFILGYTAFVQVVLPWIGFMIILFAPLVWGLYRSEKGRKND